MCFGQGNIGATRADSPQAVAPTAGTSAVAATLAAASLDWEAEIPAVGATACGEFAPVAPNDLSGQTLVNVHSNQ